MTNKEIVEAADAYRNEKIKQDKADGFSRKSLCYGDIKQAYIYGAEWCFDTIRQHCTPQLEVEERISAKAIIDFSNKFMRENDRPPTIEDFLVWQQAIDIDKAYQWLKRNIPIKLMYEEKYEFLEDFKIAMNE